LFGGLLSTLSQTTPNSQNKRRQEIERKQLEREKLRRTGDEERRKERLAKLNVIRKAEQGKWEEQAVCLENIRGRENILRMRLI